MTRSKVTRYVSKENLKWLPDHATVQFGYRKKYQQGLIKVELDFYWIRKNGKVYAKLMGEL